MRERARHVMFEDMQALLILRDGDSGRALGPRTTKLLARCTANSGSSIAETFVPDMCYDARGCCNTARATISSTLDAPISSRQTLDAKAVLPYGADVVEE